MENSLKITENILKICQFNWNVLETITHIFSQFLIIFKNLFEKSLLRYLATDLA